METERPKPIDARTLLKQELARRCAKNPRYSLRAFARTIGISHTLLCAILAGRRRVTAKTVARLLDVLTLTDQERELLHESVGSPFDLPRHEDKYDSIGLETFAVIADWYHYAILSLLEIRGAKYEARWIARRLGIHEHDAKDAMDRLEKLGLVARFGTRWKQTGLPLKIENVVSTPATRKFHRQALERALISLEEDPIEERNFSAMTFAIDPSLLPHATERIKRFRRQLMAELEKMKPPTRVYNLTVQLFPVSDDYLGTGGRHGNA